MRLNYKGVVLAVSMLAVAGCASIMHGTSQKIGISSTPTGASVSIDNKPLGNTPVFADLKRKEEHVVTIEMPGYEKAQLTITKSVSGWVWGNIVFGGVIGLAVDAIDGGLYNLSPEQLNAELRASGSKVSATDEGILVVAVLVPNPQWEKVGTLEPESVSLLR
jgi:uncharacterized protein YceK